MELCFTDTCCLILLSHALHVTDSDRSDLVQQMEFDGPLSAQEQMYILYEIKLQCYQNLSNIDLETTGTKLELKELQFYTILCRLN